MTARARSPMLTVMNSSPSRLPGLLAVALPFLTALAIVPASAEAGVSQVNDQITRDIVTFQALGATEANLLAVTFPNGKVAFHDSGAAVTAGTGCQQVQANSTLCSHKADHQIIIVSGPGNDKVTGKAGHTASSIFYGGEKGNDTLVGSDDDETLSGNEDNDVLRPGKGDDDLYGGTGIDTLDYSERTARVVVDLAVKLGNGESGENDRNMDFTIEAVVSGSGSDELRGGSGANTLRANGGEDKYYGQGGADTIHAREGVRDWIYCGDGTDTVYADFEDLVNADCENVLRANPGVQQGGNGQIADPNGPPPPDPEPPLGDAPNQPPVDEPAPAPGTGGSGDATPPAAVPGDSVAPVLIDAAFAPSRFRIRRGSALYFDLSEPATVGVRIKRLLPGRRSGKRCVAPAARLIRRGAKKCVRARAKGTLALPGAAGPNKATFSGRVGKRALKPGRYRALLVAVDGAANRSAVRRLPFRIRRQGS